MWKIISKNTMLMKLKDANNIYTKYNLGHVYLCGSYSRWEQNIDSDVDLYVEPKEFLDLYDYMNLKRELENFLDLKIDVIMPDNMKKGVKNYIMNDLELIKWTTTTK